MRNKRGDITTDPTDIKRTISKQKQLNAHEIKNMDGKDKFFDSDTNY